LAGRIEGLRYVAVLCARRIVPAYRDLPPGDFDSGDIPRRHLKMVAASRMMIKESRNLMLAADLTLSRN
jgi:hypothetical protein